MKFIEKTYNNFGTLINELSVEDTELNTIEGDFEKYSGGLISRIRGYKGKDYFERTAFKLQREDFMSKKKDLKRRSEELEKSIISKETILDALCSFDFQLMTSFIERVLTKVEEEPYESFEVEFVDEDQDEYSYIVISTAKNIGKIKELYDADKIDSEEEVIRSITDRKYALLDEYVDYEWFDYYKQYAPIELVERYPYFDGVMYDLIEFRFRNQSMEVADLMNLFLSQMNPQKYERLNSDPKKRVYE